MFSSSSNNIYNNPFDPFMTTNQTPPTPPYVASIIGNPNQDHHYSSPPFLNYPQAFLDDGDFLMSSTHLPSQQEILGSCCNLPPRKSVKKSVVTNNSLEEKEKKKRKKTKGDGDCDGVTAKKPRKRLAGKKDRHSKIHTAQGPRDRRMRLSLQIAQKFFSLQDMLGFDRASETIEWLLSKSRASIKELKDSFQVSKQNVPINPLSTNSGNKKDCTSNSSKICKKNLKSMPKAKESRDNARARARERTMLKKMKMSTKDPLEPTQLQFLESGPENPIVGSDNQETISNHSRKDEEGGEFSNVYSQEHQMDDFSIMEHFLGIANYNPSFEYFPSTINGMIDPETWNSTNNGVYDSSYGTTRGTKCSTGDTNLQVQNPNAVLANDLLPVNHSNDHEKNPNLVSFYEYLNY